MGQVNVKNTDMPMTSNLAQEEIWIEAWSKLYEIAQTHPNAEYQLPVDLASPPENRLVSFEDCLSWLQDSAYGGYRLEIELMVVRDYVGGQRCDRTVVLVDRWLS